MPFHGGNRGSNPRGDANLFNGLAQDRQWPTTVWLLFGYYTVLDGGGHPATVCLHSPRLGPSPYVPSPTCWKLAEYPHSLDPTQALCLQTPPRLNPSTRLRQSYAEVAQCWIGEGLAVSLSCLPISLAEMHGYGWG